MKRNKGFTLIELMITLSIMSILLSISLMCYSNLLNRNNNKAAAAIGEEMFELAKQQYEKDDFKIKIENIKTKIDNLFNCSFELPKKDEESLEIRYYYMNKLYSLLGDFRTENVVIKKYDSGEIIYEN
ncbi:pilus assembly FimT family protein [Clostridium oryzae]|uniref:Putative major pilin subunit n=1 Tax=Clostridium oryzae TaxID=1450648 RepID=A0A1V4ITT3_9CLOT|nr:type II secretion system protein [Clostridium oryzae]OPJ63220.1 putative major pilin subunit [Clostridium oryzae]